MGNTRARARLIDRQAGNAGRKIECLVTKKKIKGKRCIHAVTKFVENLTGYVLPLKSKGLFEWGAKGEGGGSKRSSNYYRC